MQTKINGHSETNRLYFTETGKTVSQAGIPGNQVPANVYKIQIFFLLSLHVIYLGIKLKNTKENKYGDEQFFKQYRRMSRSANRLQDAGEWHVLKQLLIDFQGK